MAKKYGKKRSHGKVKPSVLSLVPIAYVGLRAAEGYKARGMEGALAYPVASLTGYDMKAGKFNVSDAAPFYGLIIGTYAAKKIVSMAGVNRAMKALPFRL